MRKKERGITLIALVITIIVILILAGITIGSLTGDNSIIDKAGQAKNETELASAREKVEAEYIMCLERGELNADKFRTNIKNALGIEDKDIIDNGDGTWTIKFKGTDINTGEKVPFGPGVLVAETENEEWIDKDGDKVTIPGGFGIVPGQDDISEGLVITDEFDNSGNSIGNEFVWIPVGQNNKVSISNVSENFYNYPMAWEWSSGKYYGCIYEYVLGATSRAEIKNYNDVEPGRNYYDTNYAGTTGMTGDQLEQQMISDYNEMIESVKEYGGFYVAIYPVIDDYDNTRETYISKPVSFNNHSAKSWYELYKLTRNYSKTHAKCSMIWASQQWAIVNWGGSTENTTQGQYGTIYRKIQGFIPNNSYMIYTMGNALDSYGVGYYGRYYVESSEGTIHRSWA